MRDEKKTFVVEVEMRDRVWLEVKAENAEEARRIIEARWEDGQIDCEPSFSINDVKTK